jgi:alpha-L-glutamate ligase-like protein
MFRTLKRLSVATPKVLAKFKKPEDILLFEWETLPGAFALKPSRGFGGEGIIVVKRKSVKGKYWVTTQKEKVTIDDLKLHVLDILEGAYSLANIPDVAFIQEYVGRHAKLKKLSYRGTPDVRVIVFNAIPVMAMLRLPTRESKGRANVHQGAIAVGIDIATGITTSAIHHGEPITYKPETTIRLKGFEVPHWNQILELAVEGAKASQLGYVAADIVLHPDKGPMILELNARPGLQIQLANGSGLKKRMERVEDLEVENPEQGVKIAKALFSSKVKTKRRKGQPEGPITIATWEKIQVKVGPKKKKDVIAKVDTGAWRTSIDRSLAEKLGILTPENILWSKSVKSGLGQEVREVIGLTFYLADKKITTIASVANRKGMRTQMIIGRRDLEGYLVNPRGVDESQRWYQKLWKKQK